VKIVIVSPHRGDAAFSLALAIGAWLEQGHRISVVNCFTRTNSAPLLDDEFLHPNDRASYITALHAREDESWRRSYRGKQPTLLDLALKDAQIRLRCSADEVFTMPTPPDEKAVTKIRKALAAEAADALVLPLALGGQVDHRVAREAALVATPDTLPVAMYEDLPYAIQPGIEDTIAEKAREALSDAKAFYATEPATGIAAAVANKRRQVMCYDSLVTEAEADAIAAHAQQFGGRERLWANPAWTESALRGFPELL
jgi:LmbE family N-acetylglucosaminyl deacetylase